jgi:hypothetical protein
VGFALGEAVGDAAGEGDAAFSDGEDDAVGVSVATVCVSIAAGQFSRVRLFTRHWAIPKTIATVNETIPAAIAQRARRWVCRCLASLYLIAVSLRISASRSDAIMISFGGSVESDWISKK